MSSEMYNALWVDTQKYIDTTVALDQVASVAPPERKKSVAHGILSTLHTRYVSIIKRMEACYDQIVQPQKRLVIRVLLDMCLGRCLELKHEMVALDITEFNYYDNVLIEMKLVPMEVEVTIPNYYVIARAEEIERRKEQMAEIMAKLSLEAKPPVEEVEELPPPPATVLSTSEESVVKRPPPPRTSAEILLTESVLMIQRSERARKGRQRATASARIKAIKARAAEGKKVTKEEKKEHEKAAIVIQKYWRNYQIRRHQIYRKDQEALIIGLHKASTTATAAREKQEVVKNYRRGVQRERQREYEEAQVKEKAKILKRQGPWLIEDFCDEIRDWFIDWYRKTFAYGKPTFPDFPDEEDGGSFLLISGQLITPEAWIKQQIEIAKFKAKSKSERDKIKAERAKAKAKEKLQKLKEKELAKKRAKEALKAPWTGFVMKPSRFIPPLNVATAEYTEVWKNKPEKDNPHQRHYVDMIRVEKLAEVKVDVRPLCDELMRIELELLEAALERDRKKKKGKKGKKKKKKKKKKKRKKKKKKDPTRDRSTEDLFEELYRNGIIRKYPEEHLSTFIGDFSYNNFNLREMFLDPLPSLGDVRQVVLEYCILPMGSPVVHQLAPYLKAVCLAGPSGCGKHLLANAICTELGAVMFDLTPSNVVGKYPGAKGGKMLVHLVDKMSKILQPSVIFVDGAEKPWYKKVPKAERKNEPKRIGKILPKILKTMTVEDQVMLLGITKQPWAGKPKKIVKTFQKIIMIPWADYGTRFFHWHSLLMSYHGIARDIDASALAKVSKGYTIQQIGDVVRKVMTARRIATQRAQPLTPLEVLEELVMTEPMVQKDMDKFTTWFTKKTVVGKKRAKFLAEHWKKMAEAGRT